MLRHVDQKLHDVDHKWQKLPKLDRHLRYFLIYIMQLRIDLGESLIDMVRICSYLLQRL